MTETDKNLRERLTERYEQLLERVQQRLSQTEADSASIGEAIEHARESLVEMGEMTRDEAEYAAQFLWRDLNDAGHYLAETGRGLADWLQFDLGALEERLLPALLSAADQSRVEWLKLGERQHPEDVYQTGEAAGPGTLVCTRCGTIVQLQHIEYVPLCAKCEGSEFRRPER